jgi:TPR repeat protein
MKRARLAVAFVLGCSMAAAVGQDQKQKALDDCDPRRVICDVFPPTPAPGTPKPPPEGPILFKQGQEMERAGNAKDAVRVYRRAARQGSGPAAKRLGDIFSCGLPGVPPDHADAIGWYDAARKLKMKGLPPRNSIKKC